MPEFGLCYLTIIDENTAITKSKFGEERGTYKVNGNTMTFPCNSATATSYALNPSNQTIEFGEGFYYRKIDNSTAKADSVMVVAEEFEEETEIDEDYGTMRNAVAEEKHKEENTWQPTEQHKLYEGAYTLGHCRGGMISYYYKESNKGRIFDGLFDFSGCGDRYKGRYVNNLKDGEWQCGREKKIFKLGKLEYIYDCPVQFKDNHFAGSFSFKKLARGSFDNDEFLYTGQFDENGYADGEWTIGRTGGVPIKQIYTFKNGVCVSGKEVDDSRGTYKKVEADSYGALGYDFCNHPIFAYADNIRNDYGYTITYIDGNKNASCILISIPSSIDNAAGRFGEITMSPCPFTGEGIRLRRR